eukprot:TRINITY_DN2382_c0_g1_i1.p1 TRINITY_DN2382_c0_g1~~TRINITY_DN2382_c0_g1_i1.p1  ORF type:complete len:1276 (+),score=292.78 TRINITY_DN2382_c0_g1_i1:95-3922(+)
MPGARAKHGGAEAPRLGASLQQLVRASKEGKNAGMVLNLQTGGLVQIGSARPPTGGILRRPSAPLAVAPEPVPVEETRSSASSYRIAELPPRKARTFEDPRKAQFVGELRSSAASSSRTIAPGAHVLAPKAAGQARRLQAPVSRTRRAQSPSSCAESLPSVPSLCDEDFAEEVQKCKGRDSTSVRRKEKKRVRRIKRTAPAELAAAEPVAASPRRVVVLAGREEAERARRRNSQSASLVPRSSTEAEEKSKRKHKSSKREGRAEDDVLREGLISSSQAKKTKEATEARKQERKPVDARGGKDKKEKRRRRDVELEDEEEETLPEMPAQKDRETKERKKKSEQLHKEKQSSRKADAAAAAVAAAASKPESAVVANPELKLKLKGLGTEVGTKDVPQKKEKKAKREKKEKPCAQEGSAAAPQRSERPHLPPPDPSSFWGGTSAAFANTAPPASAALFGSAETILERPPGMFDQAPAATTAVASPFDAAATSQPEGARQVRSRSRRRRRRRRHSSGQGEAWQIWGPGTHQPVAGGTSWTGSSPASAAPAPARPGPPAFQVPPPPAAPPKAPAQAPPLVLQQQLPMVPPPPPPGQLPGSSDSSSSSSSSDEGSESESLDEDAEIGEVPVVAVPDTAAAEGPDHAQAEQAQAENEEVFEPKQEPAEEPEKRAVVSGEEVAAPEEEEKLAATWLPPGFTPKPAKLHRSTARWSGPAKVGWQAFFVLDLDPAVLVKPSRASISSRHRALKELDRGGRQIDWDASEAEENPNANPCEPSSTAEEPNSSLPLTVPAWNRTRAWLGLVQAALDTDLWQPRRLSSHVLRARRKGRSTGGGGADVGNPQEPPSGKEVDSGSTLLLSIAGPGGATSRRAVRLVKWRSPSLLILSPDVIVDPSKYTGSEAAARGQRRSGSTAAATVGTAVGKRRRAGSAGAATAAKSSGATPAAKSLQGGDSSDRYKASLMCLMEKLQAGSTSESAAVRECWASMSAADRVTFSSEFPQFMHLIVGLPSGAAASPQVGPTALVSAAYPGAGKGPPLAAQALSFALSPPASPAELIVRAAEIESQQLEAVWADRISFHDGVLRVNMSSLKMSDHMMGRWCKWAPSLLKTLSSAGGAPLSNADIDFSLNLLEDGGMKQLCSLLKQCDVHVERLNLEGNRLTDGSLVTLSEFLGNSRGAIHEVRMQNNTVQGSFGVMHLSRSLGGMAKYPMYRDDMQRYTPFMLFLAGNNIEQPMSVAQLLKPALGQKFPCLAEDRRFWERREECPAVQLPRFEKQNQMLKR